MASSRMPRLKLVVSIVPTRRIPQLEDRAEAASVLVEVGQLAGPHPGAGKQLYDLATIADCSGRRNPRADAPRHEQLFGDPSLGQDTCWVTLRVDLRAGHLAPHETRHKRPQARDQRSLSHPRGDVPVLTVSGKAGLGVA